MPLLRFDVIEGRDDAALKKLLDTDNQPKNARGAAQRAGTK